MFWWEWICQLVGIVECFLVLRDVLVGVDLPAGKDCRMFLWLRYIIL